MCCHGSLAKRVQLCKCITIYQEDKKNKKRKKKHRYYPQELDRLKDVE